MTLHATTMPFLKNNLFPLIMMVMLVGLWFNAGNQKTSEIDKSSARNYWESRDLSPGSHNLIVTNQSEILLIEDFPDLAAVTYDFATEFRSENNIGLDLILPQDDAVALIESMGIGEIGINQIELVERNGKKWTIGLFDSDTAKSANGYYFEQKELHDRFWVSILNIL
jgi:hypothetical protein